MVDMAGSGTVLDGAKDAEAAHMCVFSIHMIGNYNDLENICVDRFTEETQKGQHGNRKNKWMVDSQTLAFLDGLRGDVKGNPTIRLVKRKDSDVLQVTQPRARTNGHGGRRV